jgi:hypothetical protein
MPTTLNETHFDQLNIYKISISVLPNLDSKSIQLIDQF